MFPTCYLQRVICCKRCERYNVCFKSCLFQLVCADCDYYKIKKEEGERKMKDLKIGVKRLYEDAVIPVFAHPTDSGFDLFTCEDTFVECRKKAIVKTGIAFEIPNGWGIQIKNKSGITVKGCPSIAKDTVQSTKEIKNADGEVIGYRSESNVEEVERRADITVYEGTIDMDYRGEVGIMVKNEDVSNITIPKHTKIAQGVLRRVYHCTFEEIEEFSNETVRGEGGFGSTGTTK